MIPPEYIKILHIEDEDADAGVVRRYLSATEGLPCRILRCATLANGLEHLSGAPAVDLILLDQRLPDSAEEETFAAVRAAAGETPIVVMTGIVDEEEGARLVRMGAQDYLIKGEFDAQLLRRVVRYALERSRLQHELAVSRQNEARERELRRLQELESSSVAGGGGTARGGGRTTSLREIAPTVFEDLVRRYGELIDESLDLRIYKSDSRTYTDKLQRFAQDVMLAKSGPRDIVEIHSIVLQSRLEKANESRAQALVEEGRMCLLQLMGHVIGAYRNHAGSVSSGHPVQQEKRSSGE